ncbi:MAG TPA: ATP-binding protein [Candidatus Limnocylindrales bacterium]|nr:ATP-binding protein [Candidatus Limnocylindrales bacterium]
MISALLLTCFLGSLVLAAVILLRGRQTMNVLFSGVALCMAAWTLFVLLFLSTDSVSKAYLFAKLFYFAAAIFPVFLLLFAIVFPKSGFTKKRYIGLIAVIGSMISLPILLFPGYVISDIAVSHEGNAVLLDKATYMLFMIYFSVYFYMAIGIALHKYSIYRGNDKIVAGAYAFGLFINSIPGVVTNLFLPYFGNYKYIWVGPVGSLFFLSLTFYSIVKHRMFDLRFYVIRAAAYSLTVLALSFLYIAPIMYLVAIVIMGFPFVLPKFIAGVVVASFAAGTYGLVKDRFNNLTSRVFFRQSYDPERFIGDLNKAVVTNLDLDSLLKQASEIIVNNLKSEYCLFWLSTGGKASNLVKGTKGRLAHLKDIATLRKITDKVGKRLIVADNLSTGLEETKSTMQKYDISVMGRLSIQVDGGEDELGYILLGPKKSGDLYNGQDLDTLETIMNGLTVAIQNAMRFEEIQNFNITLQQQIEQATRKLRKTNAKLEALDETKDDFISMASHQLRTPLTSVKGYLSMVLEGDAGELTDMQRKMLDQSYLSSQRMVFLIADLLNVSRLKTGKFVIEPTRLHLQRVVQDEVNQLKETAKSRKLKLTYDKPAHMPELVMDETKIRQVLMNFIDNAIYYTPAGGEIHVSLKETDQTIEFRVNDSGIGVPRQEQPHLFTKFYRAGNARRARPDGTGLGLFMAKKVIIAQGGALIFESQEGKGSTFGFIFPKAKVMAAPKVPAQMAALAK